MDFLFVFVLGTIIGSFLNVVIYRVPLKQSIVFPSSHCTSCNERLKFFDLIPIISWILLRGNCRYCKTKVSYRYPLVELLTGAVFLLTYISVGVDKKLIVYFVFTSILIADTFIDVDHLILPDKLHIFALFTYILFNILTPFIDWKDSLLGALMGMIPLFILFLLTRGNGMGFGDVKFMAVIGLYLGWRQTLLALLLSFILGGFFGIILLISKIKNRNDPIPFGPWIAIAAFISMNWGKEIIDWYWHLLG